METIITIIVSVVTAVGGWEAIRYFINRKSEKRKSEAEADSAATAVIKEIQETYQIFISDAKNTLEEDRQYIGRLKDDRKHLMEERDDLRKRSDETEEKVRDLQREVARNGRMVEALRPLICGVIGCRNRKPVTISDIAGNDEIEPVKNDEL